jgi:hypothetical protein
MVGVKALAWFFGVLLLLMVAWNVFVQPSYEHRFRITLAVTTPDGVKAGSSVWAVTCSEPLPGGLSTMTGGCSTVGEAVFVDLGQGRNLIGLMAFGPRGEQVDVYDLAARAFDYADVPRNRDGNLRAPWYSYAPLWQGSRALSGNNIPTLVSFTDLDNPASARVVMPNQPGFDSAFGADYRLEQVTLEMVPAGVWPLNLVGLSGTLVTSKIGIQIKWINDPAVINNPGWMNLPQVARNAIGGLRKPYR